MFKVIRGAVHFKGEVYRKGDDLPKEFENKDGYKHVEWKGKGTAPTAKDKVAENSQIKELQKENEKLKAGNEELLVKVLELESKVPGLEGDESDAGKSK